MSKLISLLLLCLGCFTAGAQTPSPKYDKAMADSLGANDYGMKQYLLVILKSGPNQTTDKKLQDSLFRGHMANITAMVKANKLVIAGPFKKNDKEYRGIFILNAATREEGAAMLQKDPAISYGLFDTEIYEWYGSAALSKYLPYHDKVAKYSL